MRHDILAEDSGKTFILDSKYKELKRFEDNATYEDDINIEASQIDLYQVLTYASKRGLKDVYLLYPMYRYEDAETLYPIAVSDYMVFNVSISIHFIRMPFVFEEDDNKIRQQLTMVINSIFNANREEK